MSTASYQTKCLEISIYILESLYKIVPYKTVSNIKQDPISVVTTMYRFIKKNDHLWSFFYIICTFLLGYNTVV